MGRQTGWLTPFASELQLVFPEVSPEQVRENAYSWWRVAECVCGSQGGSVLRDVMRRLKLSLQAAVSR